MLPAPGSATERPLPEWAAGQPRAALQALLLLGAWDPGAQSEEDELLLGLLGCDGPTLTALCQAGQQAGVSRLEQKRRSRSRSGTSGQIWDWTDVQASWRALAPLLDGPACDRFAEVCKATLQGQGSPRLRSGIVLSLARLGNSDRLIAVEPRPSQRAAQLVQEALPPVLARWHDLADLLTRLAEAAPEAFLACVEYTLSPPAGSVVIWRSEPQTQDEPTIFAISRALGLLALDVSLLPQVTLLLARLAAYCQPSKSNQRTGHPVHTLEEIFDPRWPKTNATIEERLNALEPLNQQVPSLAFTLFARLIAVRGAIVLNLRRPEVLRLALPSMDRGASAEAQYGQQATLLGWLKMLAGSDGERWATLVRLKSHMFVDLYLDLLRDLQKRNLQVLTDPDALWAALRESLSEYHLPVAGGSSGTMKEPPSENSQRLAEIRELSQTLYQTLTPTDFTAAHAWLFGDNPAPPGRYASVEARVAQVQQAQAACVDALCQRSDRWLQLARLLPNARNSAFHLAELLDHSHWADELERDFTRLHELNPDFAVLFLARRLSPRGWPAMETGIRHLQQEGRMNEAAQLAAWCTGRTPTDDVLIWDLLDQLGEPVRERYWQGIHPSRISLPMPADSTARVIDHLMAAARWDAAQLVAVHFKQQPTTAQRLELLRRAREALPTDLFESSNMAYGWASLWEKLVPQTAADLATARQEEAKWIERLDNTQYRLRFVPAWLLDAPAQLVEIVRDRADGSLLRHWPGWPGDKLPSEEGQDFLYRWAQTVLAAAPDDDDVRVALHSVLVTLLARPRGADNLWPGQALRRVLEEEHQHGGHELADRLLRRSHDDRSMYSGFVDDLVARSAERAADCERSAFELASGWPTAADICRQLAAMYRQDAEDWKEREAMWNEASGLANSTQPLEPIFPLTELQVENFRGVTHATLHPLHPRLNIFYGRNASGKTTLLDALRIGLRKLVNKLPPNFREDENSGELPQLAGRDRRKDAATSKQAPQVRITLSGGRHREEPVTWVVERNYARGAEANDRETAAVAEYFEALAARLGHGDLDAPLPVFAFYGAGRLPSTKAETAVIPRGEARTRADGLRHALDQATRFEQGTVWFTQEWVAELSSRVGDARHETPTLRALRQALNATLLTPEGIGIKNPHLMTKTQVLAVDFARPGQNDLELELGQLSDGFRTLFALVTDLLRRIVECNPAREGETDPATRWRNTPAVVLIDEIDAHLHPSWQKTVLAGLLAAFPRAQFFVTTHSPLVLGAERDLIRWRLEDGLVTRVDVPLYGKTSDVILRDAQGTEPRRSEVQDKIKEAQSLLKQRRLEEAGILIDSLEADTEDDIPELTGLRTRLSLAQQWAQRQTTGNKPT